MLRVNHKPVDDADFPKNFFLGNNPEWTCACAEYYYILDYYVDPIVFVCVFDARRFWPNHLHSNLILVYIEYGAKALHNSFVTLAF